MCLLWDAGSNANIDTMATVGGFLIESNCRQILTGGAQCELWHDLVDKGLVWKCVDNPEIEQLS